MIFITPVRRNYLLVAKPYKNDRDGNVIQEPVYIKFEDGVYETNDEELISFLRSRINFGADFFESPDIPKTHGYQGNKVGIAKMENNDAKRIESASEIESLKTQVGQLTELIKGLVAQNTPKNDSVEEVSEPKHKVRPPKVEQNVQNSGEVS